jgi:hypothetical protein
MLLALAEITDLARRAKPASAAGANSSRLRFLAAVLISLLIPLSATRQSSILAVSFGVLLSLRFVLLRFCGVFGVDDVQPAMHLHALAAWRTPTANGARIAALALPLATACAPLPPHAVTITPAHPHSFSLFTPLILRSAAYCAAYSSCTSCTLISGCGWCNATSTCVDEATDNCPISTSCKVCEAIGSCNECLDTPSCNWCTEDNYCSNSVTASCPITHTCTVKKSSGFNGASFVGGMFLSAGLLIIAAVGFVFYRRRQATASYEAVH